jgi:hypothetical protein
MDGKGQSSGLTREFAEFTGPDRRKATRRIRLGSRLLPGVSRSLMQTGALIRREPARSCCAVMIISDMDASARSLDPWGWQHRASRQIAPLRFRAIFGKSGCYSEDESGE